MLADKRPGGAEGLSAAELADRIKDLRSGNGDSAPADRTTRPTTSAEESVVSRIHRRGRPAAQPEVPASQVPPPAEPDRASIDNHFPFSLLRPVNGLVQQR